MDPEELRERPRGQWWQSSEEMVEASYDAVHAFGVAAFQRAGANERDAEFLLSISLGKAVQGDHTRGIDNLVQMVRAGVRGWVRLESSTTILTETPGTALVDAHPRTLTALTCRDAMDLAIDKARECGVGWVSARVPAGILTQHLLQATDGGMIGVVMTQTYPLVAAHGGYGPLLGNAPVGIGIPAGDHDPIILDLALTESSASGVKLAAIQGERVPKGFILDERGNPTTDPLDFPAAGHLTHDSQMARGSLLPLGGGHKGYALIYAVSLLTAVVADASFPWEADSVVAGRPADPEQRYGSVFMALDPAAFGPLNHFRTRVDQYIDDVKDSPRKEGVDEILYPGERSQQLKRERRDAGVFLLPVSHYDALVELGRELDLPEQLPER